MAWTNYQIFLAFMMLITGSINTLSTKWADRTKAVGRYGGEPRKFNHPFLQAVGMFLGELSCLAVFHITRIYNKRKNKPMELGPQTFNPLIFLPPAMCDMIATSTMYFGLNLTFASSFQMLRGAVIVFTALLSVAFLRRVIRCHMWLGMVAILAGLILVGVADILFGNNNKNDINGIIAGDLLIVMAQIITATQMVIEEKFVSHHNVPPLQAVGWEGFFGFTILGILLVPMYYIHTGTFGKEPGDPNTRMEDVIDAFTQMGNSWQICFATFGNIVSIAFFNFSGISVTKEISATTRMVLDSCRTLIIWVVALALLWQPFTWKGFLTQAAGFAVLITGMCLYNDVGCIPYLRNYVTGRGRATEEEVRPILAEKAPELEEPPFQDANPTTIQA